MTLVVGDRIQETTTTTGTGTITLLGAVTQFQSFAAGVGNGNSTYYTIADQSGVNWEEGIGTYTTSGSTLTRTVLASSNAGALVNFPAGTKNVFCSYPAEAAVLAAPYAYPTVSPTLNLDFANSATVDPRITFVRNSTATYYDGKTTAMAEQNLLLYSNTFSNAAWVATNGTVVSGVTDPAGTTTAFSFTATGVATLYQTLTTTATPYTLSFYIQRVIGTGAVNLTLDGTILTPQTITGSWARYSVTATPTAASHTIGIQLAVITDSVNIFRSQLENRSSMTAANITTTAAITNYIPVLMTAPAGVPRLDYNPTTGQALGLLIEESRTNLVFPSIPPTTGYGFTTNITFTANSAISPDGTINATQFAITGASSTAGLGITASSATTYTISAYFKAGSISVVTLAIGDNVTTNGFRGTFDLIAVTASGVSLTGGTYTSSSISPVGNGWYRCFVTGITGTSPTRVYYSTTASTGNFYIWGAQLEAGSFATSPIVTAGAQVTRAADQASMTGTNFSSWYNQIQGSLYAEYQTNNPSSGSGGGTYVVPLGVNDNSGTITNYLQITYPSGSGTSVLAESYAGGAAQSSSNTTVYVSPTYNKAVIFYGYHNLGICCNGNLPIINTSAISPTGINTLSIGKGYLTTSTFNLNGHIRKLSYYPQALTSANLQALTS